LYELDNSWKVNCTNELQCSGADVESSGRRFSRWQWQLELGYFCGFSPSLCD